MNSENYNTYSIAEALWFAFGDDDLVREREEYESAMAEAADYFDSLDRPQPGDADYDL